MSINGSTALITGGTSGIGRAAANKLAQLGIHVLVVGRNAERGEKTVDEIRATGGKADFISADLQDAAKASFELCELRRHRRTSRGLRHFTLVRQCGIRQRRKKRAE